MVLSKSSKKSGGVPALGASEEAHHVKVTAILKNLGEHLTHSQPDNVREAALDFFRSIHTRYNGSGGEQNAKIVELLKIRAEKLRLKSVLQAKAKVMQKSVAPSPAPPPPEPVAAAEEIEAVEEEEVEETAQQGEENENLD